MRAMQGFPFYDKPMVSLEMCFEFSCTLRLNNAFVEIRWLLSVAILEDVLYYYTSKFFFSLVNISYFKNATQNNTIIIICLTV